MQNSRFANTLWSYIIVNPDLFVVEVSDFNDKLFFGQCPIVGYDIAHNINPNNQDQREIIESNLRKAIDEKRDLCFTYISSSADSPPTTVCVHVQGLNNGSTRLHLAPVETQNTPVPNSHARTILDTIYDELPVGLEIYDSQGYLIEINAFELKMLGVDNKDKILGINLFENPNLPAETALLLRQGKDAFCSIDYDFNLLNDYCTTTRTDISKLEVNFSILRDENGQVDKYIVISNNITQQIRADEQLRENRDKSQIALKAVDAVIWEFDVQKQMFFSNNEPLSNYDSFRAISREEYIKTADIEHRDQIQDMVARMSQGEDFLINFEGLFQFPHKPEPVYYSVSGAPYQHDADGRVTRYVGVRKNNTLIHQRKLLQDKILNSLPISILIKDVQDDFRYVFCNDEAKKIFGTLENRTCCDVLDEQEVQRIHKTDWEVFSTGKPYFGRERLVLKDGRKYDTVSHKIVIKDNDKRLLLTMRWDQSAENEFKRRAKLFELTLEMMNAYTWLYEPSIQRIHFGAEFNKMGRKASQVNTLEKFSVCVHPEDVALFTNTLQAVIDQKCDLWDIDCRMDLNGDGQFTWWRTRGVLEVTTINDETHHYMSGMTISIQEHKESELEMQNNQDKLRQAVRQNELILNNTSSGLAYISTDYIVQWENMDACSANLSFEAYKRGEVCYRSAHNRTEPCDDCVMQRALRSHQMEQIQFTLANDRKVEVTATPVFVKEGKVDGIVIRVDNITEREVMIEELRQAKTMAEQSDKLKSAFLANMSHEIRTPLNAIVGFSNLLIDTEEIAEREEYQTIINSNNDLLLKLINDILDMSKIEAGAIEFKYEEFDLAEYFDGMTQSMRQRVINPNVKLIDINPYSSCIVKLDRNRVMQLMLNYVTNAIKYTPKGFIKMSYKCEKGGILLYVQDSGIGIADDKKDRVFHRFAKLDEFAQGTGLGLSICKAIAESMGGNVGFDSEAGNGSTFWAFLPCEPKVIELCESVVRVTSPTTDSTEKTATHNTDNNIETKASTERKTILVAEDIYSNFLLVTKLLKHSYNIIHAKNGIEALDTIRNREHHIDLVLMDMKMPRMDGLTATTEIRKFNKKLPIIALTAHAFQSDRLAALAVGCNEYLVKPIDKTRLMAVLDEYCSVTS